MFLSFTPIPMKTFGLKIGTEAQTHHKSERKESDMTLTTFNFTNVSCWAFIGSHPHILLDGNGARN